MLTMKVEGWVNDITNDKWGTNIVIRFIQDESQERFPQRMMITASKKKESEVIPEKLKRNDKIEVTFAPYLNEGESNYSHRVYRINRAMIQEIKVLEAAPAEVVECGSDSDEDCPF